MTETTPPVWRHSTAWRVISLLTIIVVVALVLTLGHKSANYINAFEEWIVKLGPVALLVFIVLYMLLCSVLVPDTLLGIMAGATFGFAYGLMAALTAVLLGTVLQYTLSRHLLKPTIDRLLRSRPVLKNIQTAVLKQELKLQILLRLTPLNRAMTSYMLGAAGVKFPTFMLASIAMVPTLCLEVYLGYAGKYLVKDSGKTDHSAWLHDAAMLVGLALAIIVTILVSRMARKAIDEATAENKQSSKTPD